MDETAPNLVVVGASAGGVEALTTLADGLPEDLDAAVCVVLHLHAGAESRLAHIISRAGPLPALQARGSERLERGRIYVAPSDRYLIVRGGRVGGARPARERRAALDRRALPQRGSAVRRLSEEVDVRENGGEMSLESGCATLDAEALQRDASPGGPSVYGCPECGGVPLRIPLRALQERAQLSERLAERVGKAGAKRSRQRFEAVAEEARGQAETIRRLLTGPNGRED